MRPRARTLALRQQHTLPALGWIGLAALALVVSIAAAHGQAVQAPSKGDSGPQTAVPAPLPPSSGADTPGGSAKNGVITPPPTSSDPAINRGAPPRGTEPMPVIRPPGTGGSNQQVVPK